MIKTCVICNRDFYTSHKRCNCCSRECSNELKRQKNRQKLEDKLGIDNLRDYLYDLYVIQMKTAREISLIVYGKSTNSPNILRYLHYYDIPLRQGSEAVKTQWIGQKAIDRGMNPYIDDEQRARTRNIDGYDDFIKSVYERDNYTCQCCGDNRGGNLVVHHLNGYNWDIEHRTDIDNGITLCEECHRRFHTAYKYGNNTKEQYEEFIDNTNKTA